MGSQEIPLMQFGAINTGRYQAGAVPQSTNMYSWPMNNYWVTNFNADQMGEIQWSYFSALIQTQVINMLPVLLGRTGFRS